MKPPRPFTDEKPRPDYVPITKGQIWIDQTMLQRPDKKYGRVEVLNVDNRYVLVRYEWNHSEKTMRHDELRDGYRLQS